MTLEEILNQSPADVVRLMKIRVQTCPPWSDLIKEYDPKQHPIMDKTIYPDKVKNGIPELMTRIMIPDQQLYAKRMASLCVGVPAYREYNTGDDAKVKEIADVIEDVLIKNRINALNLSRFKDYFACCEIATVWFAQPMPKGKKMAYGEKPSINKIRNRVYSPINGADLYPKFDAYNDMISFSIGYKTKENGKDVEHFDIYTDTEVRFYINKTGEGWTLSEDSFTHEIGKIPVSWVMRPTAIQEDTSNITYEKEWILSRGSNYVRHNSAPNKVLTTDADQVEALKESLEKGGNRNIELSRDLVLPIGSTMNVVEWSGATEAAQFLIDELSKQQDRILQIPDLSFKALSNVSTETMRLAMSDAAMKVAEEAGRLTEFMDREISIIKEYIKPMFPVSDWDLIDEMIVRTEIIPYQVDDEVLEANKLNIQNGGKPTISWQESVLQTVGPEKFESVWAQLQEEALEETKEPIL